MKKTAGIIILCIVSRTGYSQNTVDIGTAACNSSAALDITSTTKRLLTPKITTAQCSGIALPVKVLLVYDTDVNAVYHYRGTAWAAVANGGALMARQVKSHFYGHLVPARNNAGIYLKHVNYPSYILDKKFTGNFIKFIL